MSKLKTTTQNLKLLSFTLLLCALTFTLSTFLIQPVHASSHCASIAGDPGTHGPLSRFTGGICTNPAQYNQNVRCIGTSGGNYIVTFCNANGCYEEYPEPGPNAPPLCNRPTHIQSDIGKIFGQIFPPQPIQYLGFGALGISTFLTNLVALIYSLAIVVLIFMVFWGAWDWMTSEGDKEKLESAKKKIVNAFIGIILFAIAFAAIKILGIFTGFKFFAGQ